MDASSILIFASHDLSLLKDICNVGIFLNNGEIVYMGDITETIEFYKKSYEK